MGSGQKVVSVLGAPVRRIWSLFSKQPSWHALLDWKTYYQAALRTDSPHSIVQHGGPWVGDAARQTELIDALGGSRAASIVWAPPGCGKSRFALELARRIEKGGEWQVAFVPHDEAAVRGELPELTRHKRIVFVVDDAHDCPDVVKLLAATCASAPREAPLHLVCLTRSTRRAPVNRVLQSTFPPGAVQEIDLGRPSAALVRALVDQLLPKSSPLHRDTIARFVRQSYFLAVLTCNLLSRESRLPQSFQRQDLRDRACREPLKEAVGGLCPIDAATRALGVYAALAPVAKARTDVRDMAAELSGVAREKVDSLMERMLAAGLFQDDGRGLIRPAPDLLGDLILEAACLDLQGRPTAYSKQLLERLLATDPVATMMNCGDLGQLFGADPDTDLVSGLVLDSARTVAVDNKRSVLALLRMCQPLAARRPGAILQLINILEKRGVLHRTPQPRELLGSDSVEMGALGLLLRASEVQLDIVPVALQLGRDLYGAARGDDSSSDHVLSVLREICTFESSRGVPHARAVVNALKAWVCESEVGAAVLASTLSAPFLALDMETREEGDGGLSVSRTSLSPTPEVWEVRDVAADTVSRAIMRPESVVEYVALAALERYAHTEVAMDSEQAGRWRPQLARELEKLAKAVREIPTATDKLPVWAAAELRGWHWWMQSSDALHDAGKSILTSIQTTDAYQLWKALHSQQLPVTIVVPEDDKVPAASRVEHFHALGAAREASERARQLFDALDGKHSDHDSWRTLWRAVAGQVPPIPLHQQAGAVIGEFAKRHPDAAWVFVTDAEAEGPLFPILPFLLDELGKQDPARRSDEAGRVLAGTRLEEAWLQALGTPQELREGERKLLARALNSSDPERAHYSARALLNSCESSPVEVFEAVSTAIERHPDDDVLWTLILERFAQWGSDAPVESVAIVGNRLISLMRNHSSQLRWGFQPHTRQLDKVLAILAFSSPERLQDWVQHHWGRPRTSSSAWNDESPLNLSRLKSSMAAIRNSDVADRWVEAHANWIKGPRSLGETAARGLSELSTLDNPHVGKLASDIAANPTEGPLQSFTDFVGYQGSKRDFPTQSLALLEMWARHPSAYATMDEVVVRALVRQAGVQTVGHRILAAIEARRAAGEAPPLFSASLARVEREVQEAMHMAPGS